jgi:hypothetical protein
VPKSRHSRALAAFWPNDALAQSALVFDNPASCLWIGKSQRQHGTMLRASQFSEKVCCRGAASSCGLGACSRSKRPTHSVNRYVSYATDAPQRDS